MTAPLAAITGFLRGQQNRRRDDLEEERYQLERSDRIAAQAQAAQIAADERMYQRKRDDEAAQRQRAMDERQTQADLRNAYEGGYIPQTQLQEQGRQVEQMNPVSALPDFTGITTALRAAGQGAQRAPAVYSVGGTPLAKGRMSAAEQAREDQQQQARELRESQERTQLQIAADALRGRQEMARESNELRRDLAAATRQNRPARPIPQAAMKSMIENDVALSRINDAMAAVEQAPSALGLTNMGPGAWLKNHTTASPRDIEARAALADIGSQVIHSRSGAAVTVSEYPRLAPFVPSATDNAKVAKAKLQRLASLIQEEADLYRANYSEEQGYAGYQSAPRPAAARPPLGSYYK